tara:strand:+ start:2967 stop:5537 length:2571 start_codon:yes stop_codon:yes gene_type:complete
MARVPFQQNLQVEQQVGSEVQFGATSVEPMKDVVTDDIQRSAKALQQTGQIIQKLDDELNDAEAKRLYNNLHADIQNETNRYTSLKGAQAVLPNGTTEGGDNTTPYDDTNKNFENILKTYTDQSSNGVVKYMLENMAQVSIKSAQSKITQHSLTQQRIFKEKETEAKIENHKLDSIKTITRFNEGGEHWTAFGSGIVEIQSFAIDKNWNIDPNKGEVSAQYLNMIKDYTTEVHNAAVKWFKDNNQEVLGKQYFKKHAEGFAIGNQQIVTVDGETLITSLADLQKSENEYCAVKICDNVLSYEGNSNDNRFLSEANFVMKLDSNQNVDNGNGSSIIDGNNADTMANINATKSENIENLQQLRAKSIYYNLDSPKYEQIIPQHRTGHLFAIQKLGVKKADLLYTNAIKDANIDKEKYDNNEEYFIEKNKEVMSNFNKAFLAEIQIAYAPKVNEIQKKIVKLQNTPDVYKRRITSSLGPIPGTKEYKKSEIDRKKRLKIKNLKDELNIAKVQSDKYIESLTNDLFVINKDIDYKYVNGKEYVKVDPKTNLPPLTYYETQITDTIKDPVKQEHALTELRFKYNKINKERTELYNSAYTQAEDIAFSEPDGWKMLKANGIDINSFTLEDQKILKNGQPNESNVDALVEIESNEAEVLQDENKLKSFRHQLAPGDYEYYVNQLNDTKTNKAKTNGLKIDPQIFEAALFENDVNTKSSNLKDKDPKKYHRLKTTYRDRLNFYYENGIEITYEQRKKIIKEILTDEVMFDRKIGSFDSKQAAFNYKDSDYDQLYIEINTGKGKTETVYLHEMPPSLQSRIGRTLLIGGQAPTFENIANEYYKAGRPKDTDTYEKHLQKTIFLGY